MKMKRIKNYESPKIHMELVYFDESIAAGSATVVAPTATNEMLDEWEEGQDRNGNITW